MTRECRDAESAQLRLQPRRSVGHVVDFSRRDEMTICISAVTRILRTTTRPRLPAAHVTLWLLYGCLCLDVWGLADSELPVSRFPIRPVWSVLAGRSVSSCVGGNQVSSELCHIATLSLVMRVTGNCSAGPVANPQLEIPSGFGRCFGTQLASNLDQVAGIGCRAGGPRGWIRRG